MFQQSMCAGSAGVLIRESIAASFGAMAEKREGLQLVSALATSSLHQGQLIRQLLADTPIPGEEKPDDDPLVTAVAETIDLVNLATASFGPAPAATDADLFADLDAIETGWQSIINACAAPGASSCRLGVELLYNMHRMAYWLTRNCYNTCLLNDDVVVSHHLNLRQQFGVHAGHVRLAQVGHA